jgi:hypothetical protein
MVVEGTTEVVTVGMAGKMEVATMEVGIMGAGTTEEGSQRQRPLPLDEEVPRHRLLHQPGMVSLQRQAPSATDSLLQRQPRSAMAAHRQRPPLSGTAIPRKPRPVDLAMEMEMAEVLVMVTVTAMEMAKGMETAKGTVTAAETIAPHCR